MRSLLRVWRRRAVQHAMISNAILFFLIIAGIVATDGVDWWPAK